MCELGTDVTGIRVLQVCLVMVSDIDLVLREDGINTRWGTGRLNKQVGDAERRLSVLLDKLLLRLQFWGKGCDIRPGQGYGLAVMNAFIAAGSEASHHWPTLTAWPLQDF